MGYLQALVKDEGGGQYMLAASSPGFQMPSTVLFFMLFTCGFRIFFFVSRIKWKS